MSMQCVKIEAKHLEIPVLVTGVLAAAAVEHHHVSAEVDSTEPGKFGRAPLLVYGIDEQGVSTYVCCIDYDHRLPDGPVTHEQLDALGVVVPSNYVVDMLKAG